MTWPWAIAGVGVGLLGVWFVARADLRTLETRGRTIAAALERQGSDIELALAAKGATLRQHLATLGAARAEAQARLHLRAVYGFDETFVRRAQQAAGVLRW